MKTASHRAATGAKPSPALRCTWEKLYSPCIARLHGLWLITTATGYALTATVNDFGELITVQP